MSKNTLYAGIIKLTEKAIEISRKRDLRGATKCQAITIATSVQKRL